MSQFQNYDSDNFILGVNPKINNNNYIKPSDSLIDHIKVWKMKIKI